MIGLGVLAVVLVLGVVVTAAFVLLQDHRPSARPGPQTAAPSNSAPSGDTSSGAAPTPDPSGLAGDLFSGDWDFALDDVKLKATYVAAKDYDDCGPIASARLERLGCDHAAMGIHEAEGGKLRMLRIIYVFGSETQAKQAAKEAKETDFDLPAGSILTPHDFGKWVVKDSGRSVVVGFVTAAKGVPAATASDYLHFGTADIAAALAFMDP